MAGRRDLQDALARRDGELADLTERAGKARREAELSATAAEQAEQAKLEATKAEAAGSISRGAARKAYEEGSEKAARHEVEGARLTAVAAEIAAMLERTRSEHARAEYEVAAEEARAKHAKATAAAERLSAALAAAVKEATAFTKARDGAAAASARARELAPDDVDLEELSASSWLPDGWRELVALVEEEAKRRAAEHARAAAAEQSRRTHAEVKSKELARRYVWHGDEAALAKIEGGPLAEIARRERAIVARRAAEQLDPILADLRQRRTSPGAALAHVRRLAQIPSDMLAQAEREIIALAGPEAARAREFAELNT